MAGRVYDRGKFQGWDQGPKGPPGVKDQDNGAKTTLAMFRRLGLELDVGVLGPAAEAPHRDPDGQAGPLTVAEVAAFHELGLGVPERSFVRAWFEANHQQVLQDLRAGLQQIVLGRLTPEQVTDLIGQKCVAGIRARIQSGIDPPLAESTIARKGSSTPLIDTGQLWSAISYEVRRVGAGG